MEPRVGDEPTTTADRPDALARQVICKTCGYYGIEDHLNWCNRYDDNHQAKHNCPRSKNGRYSARLFRKATECEKWLVSDLKSGRCPHGSEIPRTTSRIEPAGIGNP